MLVSNQFVEAEDKYRREVLRDHYQDGSSGLLRKVVVTLLVAGVVALAACGTAVETEANDLGAPAVVTESGSKTMTLEESFSGLAAPDWHPKHGRLDLVEVVERLTGPR